MIRPVNCPRCSEVNEVEATGGYVGTAPCDEMPPKDNRSQAQRSDDSVVQECIICGKPFEIGFDMDGSRPIFDIEIELVARGMEPVFKFGGSRYPWKDGPWIELMYDGMVRSGPEVDFFVVSDKEIEHLQEGERFKYVSDLTGIESTRSNKRGSVPPGEHWFAVWNHNEVETKVSIEAKGFIGEKSP